MAQGKKIVISLDGGEEDPVKSLRNDIANDTVINSFLKEELLKKIDHGGSIDEVKMTYGEAQKLANPQSHLISRRPARFMEE